MSEPAPAIELIDVSKRYGPRWALSRLSLTVPSRTSVLLTGHNGSGKTTLLRLLASSAAPTLGQVRVLGRDCVRERAEVRQKVALLSHSNFLYEDLTAEQNLRLLAQLVGDATPERSVRDLLDRVGLSGRAKHPVRQFSAGMRKRLSIARLLLKQPEVALLDEPFGELDPEGMRLMEDLVRQLCQSATVVLVTHWVEQGKSLCQMHLHLENGRLL